MTTCLVTGGAGFAGSHLVDHLLQHTDWKVVVWDKLTYAANEGHRLHAIRADENHRFELHTIDIAGLDFPLDLNPDYIVHMAAETHVDNSVQNPLPFVQTNIVGTYQMLEYARRQEGLKKLLFFSTDEVFGPADGTMFYEWSRYKSSNPYSASKAAGEELALAWANTYNLPVVISHCCNIFGERQHEEKFIPKLVKMLKNGERVTIHANEKGESGSRMYVYAGDVARAVQLMLEKGEIREKYNIPGKQISNLDMFKHVCRILGIETLPSLACPYTDRPGWDFSYAIGSHHIHSLGWAPSTKFDENLRRTIHSFGS